MKETKKDSKLLWFLLALLIAVAMWLYVITIVSPESEGEFNDVPVVLQGEAVLADTSRDGGLMLLMDEKPTVDLTLTGNRSDLNKLNASNITVTADLSKIYEAGTHELQLNISYPGDIPNGAIGVKRKDPGTISVTVERRIVDRPVDVVIEDGGTNVAQGYIIQEVTLDREQILISGPASVVDRIVSARIDVNYDGRKESIRGETFFITLCDADGNPVDSKWIEVDTGEVELSVVIHQVKQIPLEVTVVDGGGATRETSEVVLQTETINVHGEEKDLVGLESLNLGTIKLADYEQDTELEFDIVLPTGVEVMGDTQKVKVNVKFPELQIAALSTTQLEAINVPEGMKAEILAKELLVRIRGPKDVIETLLPENVKIVVDLTGVKLGTSNVEATVTFVDVDAAGSGALGTYTVAVTVEASEEN